MTIWGTPKGLRLFNSCDLQTMTEADYPLNIDTNAFVLFDYQGVSEPAETVELWALKFGRAFPCRQLLECLLENENVVHQQHEMYHP